MMTTLLLWSMVVLGGQLENPLLSRVQLKKSVPGIIGGWIPKVPFTQRLIEDVHYLTTERPGQRVVLVDVLLTCLIPGRLSLREQFEDAHATLPTRIPTGCWH